MLCLLEDFQYADGTPVSHAMASNYTVLQSLVYYTRSRIRTSILRGKIPDEFHPRDGAKPDEHHPVSQIEELHNVKPFMGMFIRDTNALLRDWGCLLSSERDIDVCYRIREWGDDGAYGERNVTVFAYPIWIVEASC